MKKKYTKKQITEAISYWEKQLDEARHDGHWLPRHKAYRNPTNKATIYYLGVDESDDFRGYGSYIMPDGNLTDGASNNDFKHAAVTKVPANLKNMIIKALAKYGKDKYIFVFKEEYTYGNQTHKSHARPSVVDIWYPNSQRWRYGLSAIGSLVDAKLALEDAQCESEDATIHDSQISDDMELVLEMPGSDGVKIELEGDWDGVRFAVDMLTDALSHMKAKDPSQYADVKLHAVRK